MQARHNYELPPVKGDCLPDADIHWPPRRSDDDELAGRNNRFGVVTYNAALPTIKAMLKSVQEASIGRWLPVNEGIHSLITLVNQKPAQTRNAEVAGFKEG